MGTEQATAYPNPHLKSIYMFTITLITLQILQKKKDI